MASRIKPSVTAEVPEEEDEDYLEKLERRRDQLAAELDRKRAHLEKLKNDMEDYLCVN